MFATVLRTITTLWRPGLGVNDRFQFPEQHFGRNNRFWWLTANKGGFISNDEQLENKHDLSYAH